MKKRGINNESYKKSDVFDINILEEYICSVNNNDYKTFNFNEKPKELWSECNVEGEKKMCKTEIYLPKSYCYRISFELDEMLDDAPKGTRKFLRYIMKQAGKNSNCYRFTSKKDIMMALGHKSKDGKFNPMDRPLFCKILKWLKENHVIYEEKNIFVFNVNLFHYGNYHKMATMYFEKYGKPSELRAASE